MINDTDRTPIASVLNRGARTMNPGTMLTLFLVGTLVPLALVLGFCTYSTRDYPRKDREWY